MPQNYWTRMRYIDLKLKPAKIERPRRGNSKNRVTFLTGPKIEKKVATLIRICVYYDGTEKQIADILRDLGDVKKNMSDIDMGVLIRREAYQGLIDRVLLEVNVEKEGWRQRPMRSRVISMAIQYTGGVLIASKIRKVMREAFEIRSRLTLTEMVPTRETAFRLAEEACDLGFPVKLSLKMINKYIFKTVEDGEELGFTQEQINTFLKELVFKDEEQEFNMLRIYNYIYGYEAEEIDLRYLRLRLV